jgi:hypothetical protein
VVAEGLSVRAVEELVTVGEPADRPRRQRHPKMVAPKVKDLADRLSDHFDTRVRVELGRTKGKIVIEFATIDDLERIVALIDGMRPEPFDKLRTAPVRTAPVEGRTAGASTSSARSTDEPEYRQIDIPESDTQEEEAGAGSAASV